MPLKVIPLKKGDRVEFIMSEQPGDFLYGVVSRGGKKPTVYLDGGIKTVTAPAKCFTRSNHPIPADEPSIMDNWDVKNSKDFDTGRGVGFAANITLNGKVVLFSNNLGNGGCNVYRPVGQTPVYNIVNTFKDDAKAWAKQFGSRRTLEIEDSWMLWATYYKPYGMTAVDYFKMED